MWIMTTIGFFSIVKDREARDDTMLVRARTKRDAEAFLKAVSGSAGSTELYVLETPKADYPFRVRCPRRTVQVFIHEYIDDLDYGNFKAMIRSVPHMKAYATIWQILRAALDPRVKDRPTPIVSDPAPPKR